VEWLGYAIRMHQIRAAMEIFLKYAKRYKESGKAQNEMAGRCIE
jgi:TolA-binding protein